MLSILIPIYNFDVTELVLSLQKQAIECNIDFEIILMDDASKKKFCDINSKLQNANNIIYIQLTENIGRSKIRNKLAETAKFEYLIFMDCDSEITCTNFIKNYLVYCNSKILVYGGRTYQNDAPADKNLYLRWIYGIKREVKSSEIRKKNPNKSFMTNNFLISKSIFNEIKFNENIRNYGHEDTLFGYELKKKKISIIHIDNPLKHIGLENNSEFLAKTEQGIKNLKLILQLFPIENELEEDIALIKYYHKIKKIHIAWLIKLTYNITKKFIICNLNSKRANLLLFDLFKLYLMLTK